MKKELLLTEIHLMIALRERHSEGTDSPPSFVRQKLICRCGIDGFARLGSTTER